MNQSYKQNEVVITFDINTRIFNTFWDIVTAVRVVIIRSKHMTVNGHVLTILN